MVLDMEIQIFGLLSGDGKQCPEKISGTSLESCTSVARGCQLDLFEGFSRACVIPHPPTFLA